MNLSKLATGGPASPERFEAVDQLANTLNVWRRVNEAYLASMTANESPEIRANLEREAELLDALAAALPNLTPEAQQAVVLGVWIGNAQGQITQLCKREDRDPLGRAITRIRVRELYEKLRAENPNRSERWYDAQIADKLGCSSRKANMLRCAK